MSIEGEIKVTYFFDILIILIPRFVYFDKLMSDKKRNSILNDVRGVIKCTVKLLKLSNEKSQHILTI